MNEEYERLSRRFHEYESKLRQAPGAGISELIEELGTELVKNLAGLDRLLTGDKPDREGPEAEKANRAPTDLVDSIKTTRRTPLGIHGPTLAIRRIQDHRR